jgi:CIC family chloride channel protein
VRRRFELDENTTLIVLAVLVGTVGGVANVLFRLAVEAVEYVIRGQAAAQLAIAPAGARFYLLPLLPALGAVLLIPLALLFPGQIYGYGLPSFLENVNLHGAILKKRLILPKILAAAVTIGSGGSAGLEGPVAQLGGGLGSLTGQVLRASAARMRVLVASGVAASIGATFNAPITGVMFAVEIILLGDFQLQSFVSLVLAAGVATVIARAAFGTHPAFVVPEYYLVNPLELVSYVVLGLCAGAAAVIFITVFYRIRDLFERVPLPMHAKPFAGALVVGSAAIVLPQIMGNGYRHIQEALVEGMSWKVMLALVGAKILATSVTLGSGGVGGTFAPSLFIGTMLGGAFGALAAEIAPMLTAAPGAYAMVGMAAFLAATTQAPLTAAFLLFELTASYMIVLPVLFCITAALIVARAVGMPSIDEVELQRRGINLRAGKEASILQGIRVAEVMSRDVQVVPDRMPLRAILGLIASSRHEYFPVVDESGAMSGALTVQDLREVLFEEQLTDLVVAKDVARDTVAALTPDDTLARALDLLTKHEMPALPVTERRDSRRVVGLVRRDDVLAAYNSQLLLRYGEQSSA